VRTWPCYNDGSDADIDPLEVVYEELADDSVGRTRRVLSFLGLPTDVEPRPLTVKMDSNRCRPV